MQVTQFAVFEESAENGCQTLITAAVLVQDYLLNEGLFRALLIEELLHGVTVAII